MKNMLLLSLVAISVSCSSPLDKAYKKETFVDDMVLIKKQVSDEDFALLTAYWGALSIGQIFDSTSNSTLGKTYGDLLKEAKDWKDQREKQELEEKLLAEKAQREEAERTQRLNKALTVALYKKGFKDDLFQDYITMSFSYENKTDKEIRAFTGSIEINDLFDNLILETTLTTDKKIGARSTLNDPRTLEYNQFMDEHNTLLSKNLEDLKVVWKPEKIIFSDGSELN
jgi:hypothetical protein